jgi:hypothetical protein
MLASAPIISYSHLRLAENSSMNIAAYSTALTAILIGMAGLIFLTKYRTLRAAELARAARLIDVTRYQPMQRLLSTSDLALVAGDKELTKLLRKRRYKVFRSYLRCLTKDYGALLGGVRLMMVQSQVDRPDLAGLLFKGELRFSVSLCKIEAALLLYRFGIATPDVHTLVDQVRSLGTEMQAPALPAAA